MTIIMSEKHQITIPNKIAKALGARKGSMFKVALNGNRIELIPVELVEKVFTDKEYESLNHLCKQQQGKEKRVTKNFIETLKKGGI